MLAIKNEANFLMAISNTRAMADGTKSPLKPNHTEAGDTKFLGKKSKLKPMKDTEQTGGIDPSCGNRALESTDKTES